jgi:hypothetical protein
MYIRYDVYMHNVHMHGVCMYDTYVYDVYAACVYAPCDYLCCVFIRYACMDGYILFSQAFKNAEPALCETLRFGMMTTSGHARVLSLSPFSPLLPSHRLFSLSLSISLSRFHPLCAPAIVLSLSNPPSHSLILSNTLSLSPPPSHSLILSNTL